MIVLDLQCAVGHRFEAWFGSAADYQTQSEQGRVACPLCGNTTVHKLPSAPRLNLLAPRSPHSDTTAPTADSATPEQSAPTPAVRTAAQTPDDLLHAAWLALSRHAMEHSEDVGPRFAEEARRIHYGESDERSIRGQTTAREAHELQEEGIEVLPIAIPALHNHTLH